MHFPPPPATAESARCAGVPHVYKTVGNTDLVLHLVESRGRVSDELSPALLFFHGGGWTKGSPSQFNDHARHFSRRGVTCLLVHYRLVAPGETPAACMRDAKSAMRWARRHAKELGIDPHRIGAVGGSAGAQIAASAALLEGFDEEGEDAAVSARPDTLILFNPVLDLGPGGFGHHRVGEEFPTFSPLRHIGKETPPCLILSGTADQIVPPATLEAFQSAIRAAGGLCELCLYKGVGHGFYLRSEHNGAHHFATLEEIDRFLVSLGWCEAASKIPPQTL